MIPKFTTFSLGLVACLSASTALADTWIQIAARPSLTEATATARSFSAQLPNVVGFTLPGRWHAITLGPYASEAEAENDLRLLAGSGLVPRDAYLTEGERFGEAFWPVGFNPLTATTVDGATAAPTVEELDSSETEEAVDDIVLSIDAPDETLGEARRSEAQLDRPAREALQIALRFTGHYNSTIDGAFGAGTRSAMASWQAANGHEATGILTTRQRGEVLAAYRDATESLDIGPVADEVAGISVDMPRGLVEFAEYTPPFAKYASKDGSGVQVLLISQTGSEATLGGLYEILQTLEIMPLEGARNRNGGRFTISGQNDKITSYAEASVQNGEVKGFVLVWPNDDEQRRKIALDAMRASFTRAEGVLPDAYGEGATQAVDLLAGLSIRRPERAGSGFFVDGSGKVVTAAALVSECGRIMLDDTYPASVAATSDGLALLTPDENIAPIEFAEFDSLAPRLQSEVSVSGFAYEGRLGAPTLNYGILSESYGLNGEEDLMRLAMNTLPGEEGGPLLNDAGAVIGMLAPQSESTRTLPEDVAFAYDMEKLATFLSDNGVSVKATTSNSTLSDTAIVARSRNITTLVSCWN